MFVKAAVAAGDGCDSDDVDETAARSCSRADCGKSILSPTREDGISEEGSTDNWLDQFSTGEAITEMQGNFSFPRIKVQVMVMAVEDRGGLVESCDKGILGRRAGACRVVGVNRCCPAYQLREVPTTRSFEKLSVKGWFTQRFE